MHNSQVLHNNNAHVAVKYAVAVKLILRTTLHKLEIEKKRIECNKGKLIYVKATVEGQKNVVTGEPDSTVALPVGARMCRRK